MSSPLPCVPLPLTTRIVTRPMTADPPGSLAKAKNEGEVSITNHPIYYFDDGSLILDVQVERFKLHHTLLSRHSRYFSSNVLQKGESDTINETVLYHHVVAEELGVNSKDVEALLQHIYHDKPFGNDSDFSYVSSLLRVTSPQQFDFPQLHLSALRIFKSLFPHDPSSFTNKHPLHEALAVAQQFKLDSIRKAVLYSLMTTTEFDTTGGEDTSTDPAVGTTPTSNAAQVNTTPNDQSPTKLASAKTESMAHLPDTVIYSRSDNETPTLNPLNPPLQISKEDAATCMTLMTKVVEHFTPILFTPAATPHMKCTDVFADTWMSLVIQPAIEDDGVYKPLETLERIKSIDWATRGLCPSCVEEKKEEWSEEQRIVWKLMDKWLGIDSV